MIEALRKVDIKTIVFWGTTLYSSENGDQLFGGIDYAHIQGRRSRIPTVYFSRVL